MEHQSAVAYGNRFQNGYGAAAPDGTRDWTGVNISPRFDFIIIHESGHEWFGNSVSAADRCDMWIHEAWTTYLETLFVEFHYGRADALKYTSGLVPKVHNHSPILTECGTATDPPQDQYFKGALMIATLRSWLATTAASPAAADREWFTLLHDFYQQFKYQNISTATVISWWNDHTSHTIHHDLTPFFDQYLRHTAIPALELTWLPDTPGSSTHTVLYKWQADEPAFAMPVRAAGQLLHPTTAWQTLQTPLKPEDFAVSTDLAYINVSRN